jgi:uncharacterized protein (TIGR04141 family)
MANLHTFSLYLVKGTLAEYDDLLTENARQIIQTSSGKKSISKAFADGGALYIFPGHQAIPKWVPLLRPSFSLPDNLFSQSPSALLIFKSQEHTFVLTFSYAHVYLDLSKIEADFGLKVVVNAVSDEKLRSVERSNIGAAIRDFAQAAGQRDLRSFGLDDALDLIRKVSGRATDRGFANMVTGSRALRFSKQIELSELPQVAIEAVAFFKSRKYKKTSFKIIDFLSPVSDPVLESHLDERLVAAVREGSDEFEVAIPEIIPERLGSFRFEHAGFTRFYPDLSLELYREGLGTRLAALTVAELKRHIVAAYVEDDSRVYQYWSVHHSLVGSLVLDNQRYALNEGSWYHINKLFKDAADARFIELCGDPDAKMRPLKKIYPAAERGRKVKVAYQSEDSYNEEIAAETGYLLLDRKLIGIDDVPGPGIEVCDLVDLSKRRFIHVKKGSRQSSVLSHFFKQGSNSAQMIRKYEPFKAKLIERVQQDYGRRTAKELQGSLDSGDRWTIDFQIADFPRPDNTHNIPFFSKLTLREEARNIEAMGFDVRVNFIKLTRVEKAAPKPT